MSQLDPFHASLTTKQRRDLYQKVTKRFHINQDKSITGDIIDNKFATRQHPMPLWQQLFVFWQFNTFVCLYFMPIPIICIMGYYFFIHQSYISLIILSLFTLYIEFHPVQLWRNFIQNGWYFCQYSYFSYRFAYHSSTKDYVINQINGNKDEKSLIFISMPHAIFPYASQLLGPIARDVLNKPIVSSASSSVDLDPKIKPV